MKRNKIAQVRALLEANPKIKTEAVMKALGTTKSYTYVLMSKARSAYAQEHGHTINSKMADQVRLGKRLALARSAITNLPEGVDTEDKNTPNKTGKLIYRLTGTQAMLAAKMGVPIDDYAKEHGEVVGVQPDPVNHPAHYTAGGIETIDFIEAKKLGYNLGNVVKYITRSGLKGNQLEDLRKAQWYLSREIATLK